MSEEEIYEGWLSSVKQKLKYLSYTKYESTFHVYIESYLRNDPLETLSEEKIKAYLNELLDKGIAYTRVKFIKIVFKSLYLYCEKNHGYKHIDFSIINIDSSSRPENQFTELSQENEKILYEYCMKAIEPLRLGILLSLYMGLRMSEICVLKYEDVHFERQSISVHRYVQKSAVGHTNDELEIEGWPARREIYIPNFLFEYLKEYKECYFVSEKRYLLTNQERYMKPRTIQRNMNQISRKLGIDFTLGKLRSTFEKRCVDRGMNIYAVLSIMGKSVIKIELNEEMRMDLKKQQTEMDRLKT